VNRTQVILQKVVTPVQVDIQVGMTVHHEDCYALERQQVRHVDTITGRSIQILVVKNVWEHQLKDLASTLITTISEPAVPLAWLERKRHRICARPGYTYILSVTVRVLAVTCKGLR
jgi:hypothetical protein